MKTQPKNYPKSGTRFRVIDLDRNWKLTPAEVQMTFGNNFQVFLEPPHIRELCVVSFRICLKMLFQLPHFQHPTRAVRRSGRWYFRGQNDQRIRYWQIPQSSRQRVAAGALAQLSLRDDLSGEKHQSGDTVDNVIGDLECKCKRFRGKKSSLNHH